MSIKSVCIYCGSAAAIEPYKKAASTIAAALAQKKLKLVFGGGRMGLMGVVADAALAQGGEVVGVLPKALREREVQHDGVTELHIVPDMHTRKRMMVELADAFVMLPGSFGTLDEFFDALTWKRLKFHNKPIIIFNQDGFWDHLIALFRSVDHSGMSFPGDLELYSVASTTDELIQMIERLIKAS